MNKKMLLGIIAGVLLGTVGFTSHRVVTLSINDATTYRILQTQSMMNDSLLARIKRLENKPVDLISAGVGVCQ